MPPVEIDSILAPISGADPCGPNLEYDVQFASLERDAAGKPEQQIGSTVIKAEDPDWAAVEREARALLARSKDLRVGVHLAKALLRTGAWEGFAAGLGALRHLLAGSWEGVHPRLDPEDENDPTARINILANLGDAVTAAAVRATPLVSSRVAGRFSLREVEIASGEAPAGEGEAPTLTLIEGVAAEMELPALEATAAALSACVQGLAAVEAVVGEKTGQVGALTFGRLPALVRKAAAFVEGRLALRRPAVDAAGDGAGPVNGASGHARPSGEIASREDVIRALDRILAYYARYEPSSPIPMLIERSKKLVAMSFVDIIKELVPDGVSQVEVLRGRSE
jgi:type VI secretion system protein ImpA